MDWSFVRSNEVAPLVRCAEVSQMAKLLIYWSIFVSALTYSHEVWVGTERMRLQTQTNEISFFQRVAGHSLRDRMRSFHTQKELGRATISSHRKIS